MKTYVWQGNTQFVPAVGRTCTKGDELRLSKEVAASLGNRIAAKPAKNEVKA